MVCTRRKGRPTLISRDFALGALCIIKSIRTSMAEISALAGCQQARSQRSHPIKSFFWARLNDTGATSSRAIEYVLGPSSCVKQLAACPSGPYHWSLRACKERNSTLVPGRRLKMDGMKIMSFSRSCTLNSQPSSQGLHLPLASAEGKADRCTEGRP